MSSFFRSLNGWFLLPLGPSHFSAEVPHAVDLVPLAHLWMHAKVPGQLAYSSGLQKKAYQQVERKITDFLNVEVGAPTHDRHFDPAEFIEWATENAADKEASEMYRLWVEAKLESEGFHDEARVAHEQGMGTPSFAKQLLQTISDPLHACWGQAQAQSASKADHDMESLCASFDGLFLGSCRARPGSLIFGISLWGKPGVVNSTVQGDALLKLLHAAQVHSNGPHGRPGAARVALRFAKELDQAPVCAKSLDETMEEAPLSMIATPKRGSFLPTQCRSASRSERRHKDRDVVRPPVTPMHDFNVKMNEASASSSGVEHETPRDIRNLRDKVGRAMTALKRGTPEQVRAYADVMEATGASTPRCFTHEQIRQVAAKLHIAF